MKSTINVNGYEWTVDSVKSTVFVPKLSKEYSFDTIKKMMDVRWKDELLKSIPDLVKSKVLTKVDAKTLVERHWNDEVVDALPHLVKSKALTKTDSIRMIKDKIESDNMFALRVLMKIYSYQTEHEKCAQRCSDYNNAGFNRVDANILTSIAQGYKSYGRLTEKQYDVLSWKMVKYAEQFYNCLERSTK